MIKILQKIIMFLAGMIVAYCLANLYHLTSKNLVLENYLLENEINDYIAAKLEQRHE